MLKPKDLLNIRFGRLVVVSKAIKSSYWTCKCDCGNVLDVLSTDLNRGQKYCRNCAPKGRPSHGLSHLPEFSIWAQMKQRCDNPKCDAYENYGARGIRYSKRWERFENFFYDMGSRPSKRHTLERNNNDGNYEPNNCRWATRKEQARNFRHNRILTHNGESKCISEWAEIYGITHDTISSRIDDLGWTPQKAITTPINLKYSH